MELNPNHSVTSEMTEQWHKIVAVLMFKLGLEHTEITPQDLTQFANSGLGAVTVRTENEVIELNLISWDEAERLAKLEGGLPH
jgi:hypothetical protein